MKYEHSNLIVEQTKILNFFTYFLFFILTHYIAIEVKLKQVGQYRGKLKYFNKRGERRTIFAGNISIADRTTKQENSEDDDAEERTDRLTLDFRINSLPVDKTSRRLLGEGAAENDAPRGNAIPVLFNVCSQSCAT